MSLVDERIEDGVVTEEVSEEVQAPSRLAV